MTHLFRDSEWAQAAGEKLASLTLVSDDGTHEFYTEIKPRDAPTAVLRSVVYPQLNRGTCALQPAAFTTAILGLLATVPDSCASADYSNDLNSLKVALAGLDLAEERAQNVTVQRLGP
jgi:hypothetical protein